jgi:hypothetical protein
MLGRPVTPVLGAPSAGLAARSKNVLSNLSGRTLSEKETATLQKMNLAKSMRRNSPNPTITPLSALLMPEDGKSLLAYTPMMNSESLFLESLTAGGGPDAGKDFTFRVVAPTTGSLEYFLAKNGKDLVVTVKDEGKRGGTRRRRSARRSTRRRRS